MAKTEMKKPAEKKEAAKETQKKEMPKEQKKTDEKKDSVKEETKEKTAKRELPEEQGKKDSLKEKGIKTKKEAETKKQAAVKPKEKKKPKAVNKIRKTEEQKKLQEKIKKKKVPVIRGNFGKAWLRRKSIKKWQKWRKTRGIDFFLKKENGAKPLTGFRTPKEIRNLHPSGLKEIYVRNMNELKEIKGNAVIRLQATIGKKARKEMIKTAKEMNLRILN